MKNFLCVFTCAIFLFTLQACEQKKKAKNYNDQTKVDQKGLYFIVKGIEGSMSEIESAKLASTNSQNSRVIGLAKMIIDDHTKVSKELMQIQREKQVTADNQLTPDSKRMITELTTKQGADFDKAYINMMIADHTAAIQLYNNDGAHNTSATIKNFAEKTLPVLQAHLDSAKAIQASLK